LPETVSSGRCDLCATSRRRERRETITLTGENPCNVDDGGDRDPQAANARGTAHLIWPDRDPGERHRVSSKVRLLGSHHPEASWVGIGLAAFTAPTMPLLARAKRNVGQKLSSSATVSEASQNMICAYLSIALLVGLLANALLGWWWADPAAALVIAAIAAKEGVDAWRGESCDCC
jgi:hypothetical protein